MHPLISRLIEATPERVRAPVELTLRTVNDAINDRVPGLAAEVAFFVILSLPPLMLTVIATAGPIGSAFDADFATDLIATTRTLASNIFTQQTVDEVVVPAVTAILDNPRADVASFGFVIALYAASRALKVILTAVTIAYDLEETRPPWLQRIWGLGLTVAGIVAGIAIIPVIVAGPELGEILAERTGVDAGLAATWRIAYWPGVVVVATGLIASLYHFGAPWHTPWRRDLPGALLAMLIWVAGSVGLRVYATNQIAVENSIYGPIAGPLVLLLWLYVSAFAVLLGAELNAEVERMWPSGPHRRPGPATAGPPRDGIPEDDSVERADRSADPVGAPPS